MPYDYKKLKAGRERMGWTASHLASLLGVSSWAIGLMDRGERQNPPTIKAYADAVGLDMDDIQISDVKFARLRAEDDDDLEPVGPPKRRRR